MRKNIIPTIIAAVFFSIVCLAQSTSYASSSYSSSASYTGLVVDCRGLALQRTMSPVVKSDSGESVYGAKNLDYSFVTHYGSADYSTDINKLSRAGSYPLFVKAESLTNHNTYPVISAEDAKNILSADNHTGFLKKSKVVFLY